MHSIDLIIIGISLFVIGLSILNHSIIKCFVKESYIGKSLGIILASFSVLAFLFGLGANALAEKQHESESKKDYHWFYPKAIFNFPIDQLLKYSFVDTINNNLVNTSLNDTDSLNYIFIIDKTYSNKISVFEKEVKQVKDSMYKVFKSYDCPDISVDSLNTQEDVLLMSIARYLCSKQDFKYNYSILLYNGSTDFTDLFETITINGDYKKEHNYCDFLKAYYNKNDSIKKNLDKIQPSKRYTDFAKIFNKVDSLIYNKNQRYVIFILSDFLHERNNWKQLEKSVKKIVEIGSYPYLKLLVLENKNIYDNKKRERIEKTKSLIKQNKPYVFLYEFKQGEIFDELSSVLNDTLDVNLYLAAISQVSDTIPIDTLNLYYPFTYGKFIETNKSDFKFKCSGKFMLCIRNESVENYVSMDIEYDSIKRILINEGLNSIDIDSSKSYTATFQPQSNQKNIYLEIANEKGARKILITFKQLIPKTICYGLIFIYTLIILLFCSCLYLFTMKFHYCLKQRYNLCSSLKFFLSVIYHLTSISFYLIILYYCNSKMVQLSIYQTWIISVISASILLAAFLYHEIEGYNDTCTECLNKNIKGNS